MLAWRRPPAVFPDVFCQLIGGGCWKGRFGRSGCGASTSLNRGWAASPTSCRISPSLVERKAPLCRIRASATSLSTWLGGAEGLLVPRLGHLDPWHTKEGPHSPALPGHPICTPCVPPPAGSAHLREEQASTTTWTCSPRSRRSKAVFWGHRQEQGLGKVRSGQDGRIRQRGVLSTDEGPRSCRDGVLPGWRVLGQGRCS